MNEIYTLYESSWWKQLLKLSGSLRWIGAPFINGGIVIDGAIDLIEMPRNGFNRSWQ
jgi:hypothetical protein